MVSYKKHIYTYLCVCVILWANYNKLNIEITKGNRSKTFPPTTEFADRFFLNRCNWSKDKAIEYSELSIVVIILSTIVYSSTYFRSDRVSWRRNTNCK